jgi:hypothetical protein
MIPIRPRPPMPAPARRGVGASATSSSSDMKPSQALSAPPRTPRTFAEGHEHRKPAPSGNPPRVSGQALRSGPAPATRTSPGACRNRA